MTRGPAAPPAGRSGGRRTDPRVVVVLVAVMLTPNLPTPLWTAYEAEFGFGPGTVTITYAGYVVGVLGASLLLGTSSDVWGRRPVLLAALGLAAAGSAGFAAAEGPEVLFAGRLAHGAAIGLVLAAAPAALIERDARRDPGRAALTTTLTFVLAGAVAPVAAGLLAERVGRSLDLPWALHLGLCVVAVAVLFAPASASGRPGWSRPGGRWRVHVPRIPPAARAVFAANAGAAFTQSSVISLFAALAGDLLRTLGLTDPVLIAVPPALVGLASAAAQLAGRRHLGPAQTATGLLVLTAGLVLTTTAVAADLGLAAVAVGAVLSGAGQGLTYLGVVAATGALAAPEHRAEAQAAMATATYLGFGVPLLGLGLLTAPLGLIPATWIFTAFVGVLAVGAAFALHFETAIRRLRLQRSLIRPPLDRGR